jgi:lysine 6-dehydrogenase
VEKIKLLKALGFFEEKPLQTRGGLVSPRDVTAKLFERELKKKDVPDIVVMRIQVSGTEDGKRYTFTYNVFESSDKKRQVTAMARTTAYTTSVAAQLIANDMVSGKGVVPPEKLGMREKVYNEFLRMMRERKIIVKEDKRSTR